MYSNPTQNITSYDLFKQVSLLKARIRNDITCLDPLFMVGTEVEACLLDSKSKPVNARKLIDELSESSFIKKTGCGIDCEYGSCQFEFKTPPISFFDLSYLESLYEEFIIDNLAKIVNKVYPDRDVIPVFLGANPSPWVSEDSINKDNPRYLEFFNLQNKLPDIELEGVHFRPSHIAAAIQGFHFHLQGRNPDNVTKMFNHILNLIPSVIVLGANSKLLGGKIYSYHEPRIYLYDRSEQQNSGFPSLTKYLDGIEDYVDYVISKKTSTQDYFELEKGRHDDVRIRLNTRFYRVETRVASVQISPKSMIAMIEFFVGYVYNALIDEEKGNRFLRPLSSLREEREMAIISGYETGDNRNNFDTIKIQLEHARRGLEEMNTMPHFISILDTRLKNKISPSEYVSNLWDHKFNGSIEKTIFEIISEMWERTRNNNPIC